MNIRENLKAYLDGELSPSESAQVEAALQQDPALQAELDQIRMLSSALAASAPAVTPAGLEATLDRLQRTAAPSPWVLPASLGLGVVAVVCWIALAMNSGTPPPFHEESPMPTPKHRAPFKGATGFKILVDKKLVVGVDNLEESAGRAQRFAKELSGDVQSVRSVGSGPAAQQILIISVPAAKMKDAMERFRSLGAVEKGGDAPATEAKTTEGEPSETRVISLALHQKTSR